MRVDACKCHHHVRVVLRRKRYLFIGDATPADLKFPIDCKHHQTDFSFSVVRDGFRNGWRGSRFEILALSLFKLNPVVIVRRMTGDFCMSMNVDSNQVGSVHINLSA
ncbi:hypothetical protein D3C86_1935680 [compost metagenome]